MPTWKKLIVSGSQAHLAAVTASTAVLVGTNQAITTSPSTTFLSGSFSGSFSGNGAGLTGVTATFPVTQLTPLTTTAQVFINDGANKYATVAQFNSASWNGVSGDIKIDGTTGVATIQPDSVALGTDTTGNYVASVAHSTGITAIPAASEGAAVTVSVSGASTLNTNRITKWTGTAFADSSLTDNGTTITGATSIQLTGANSILTGSFTGSFTGPMTGTASWATNAITASVTTVTDTTTGVGPYYITFKDATTGVPVDRIDSTGLRYNATSNALTSSVFVSDLTSGVGFVGTSSYALVAPYSGLTGVPAGIVSSSTLSSTTQGQVTLTTNGVGVTTNLTALQAADTPTFNGLTANGATFNLVNTTATTVNFAGAATTLNIGAATGTTTVNNNLSVLGTLYVQGNVTAISSSNLYVADQFILLASGSPSNTDGGFIIDRGTDAAGNIAYGYDATTRRWGYQNGLVDTTNAIDPTSASGVSGSFAGVIFTQASHGATKPTTGEFAVQGAIYTEDGGDIWIYSGT